MKVTVRLETPEDYSQVAHLIEEAFRDLEAVAESVRWPKPDGLEQINHTC